MWPAESTSKKDPRYQRYPQALEVGVEVGVVILAKEMVGTDAHATVQIAAVAAPTARIREEAIEIGGGIEMAIAMIEAEIGTEIGIGTEIVMIAEGIGNVVAAGAGVGAAIEAVGTTPLADGVMMWITLATEIEIATGKEIGKEIETGTGTGIEQGNWIQSSEASTDRPHRRHHV